MMQQICLQHPNEGNTVIKVGTSKDRSCSISDICVFLGVQSLKEELKISVIASKNQEEAANLPQTNSQQKNIHKEKKYLCSYREMLLFHGCTFSDCGLHIYMQTHSETEKNYNPNPTFVSIPIVQFLTLRRA